MDPTAARIGAVNTLIRAESGKLHAYNTDWSAAISAIEAGLAKGQDQQASLHLHAAHTAHHDYMCCCCMFCWSLPV